MAEIFLMFILTCGVPQLGVMWGGDVEPQRFVVELMDDGNILIPTEVAEDFKYITSHPDLVVEQWETVHPAIAPLVCADRVNA